MTIPVGDLSPRRKAKALIVEDFLMWCQDQDLFLAERDGPRLNVLDLEAHGQTIRQWAEQTKEE